MWPFLSKCRHLVGYCGLHLVPPLLLFIYFYSGLRVGVGSLCRLSGREPKEGLGIVYAWFAGLKRSQGSINKLVASEKVF